MGQPFGRPDVPDVNMMEWMRSGLSRRAAAIRAASSTGRFAASEAMSARDFQPWVREGERQRRMG